MEFRAESRSRLYFDQYLYGIRCYVPDALFLRQLDHNYIDELTLYRNTRAVSPWNRERISEAQVERLHQLCDLLQSSIRPFKKICHVDHLYLYSNDMAFLATVAVHPAVCYRWAGWAQVDQPAGVVLKKDSPFGFRTFFRERYLDSCEFQALTNFLEPRLSRYWPSPAMRRQIFGSHRRYVRSYYFVDHYDQGDLLLLNLAVPDLIRKTMPIQTK